MHPRNDYDWSMPREFADILRNAITASGHSAYGLAKKTGVPQSTITRFLNGSDMRISTASRLAAFLGLELK